MWTETPTFDLSLSKKNSGKPEVSITAAGGHVVAQPLGLQLPLLLLGDRHVVDLGDLLYNLQSYFLEMLFKGKKEPDLTATYMT